MLNQNLSDDLFYWRIIVNQLIIYGFLLQVCGCGGVDSAMQGASTDVDGQPADALSYVRRQGWVQHHKT